MRQADPANLPAFTAINTGLAPVVANIEVVPFFDGGCPGDTLRFTITVNPTARVNPVPDTVVCNGEVTVIPFGTTNTGGVVTYVWTNDDPTIGLAAGGSGDLSFTATNAGTSPLVATIQVTPSFDGGCAGSIETFTITVNPTAQVNPVNDTLLCNETTVTEVVFTTVNSGGVTTYAWTNDNPSIGLAASGTGNIPEFTALNPGLGPVVANLEVVPFFDGECAGDTMKFSITVNPTARVNPQQDTVVCNGEMTAVPFGTTNTGGVVTYDWTNTDPTIGLAVSGTGDLSVLATNAGTSPKVATIQVTPKFDNDCDGDPMTFTITVNPTAQVNLVNDTLLCNGETVNEVVFTTLNSGGVTSYAWTNDDPSIGLAAAGTGNIAAFTAVNTGTSPVTATIEVTPTFDNNGACSGPVMTFTITVNPTAEVNPVNDTVLCNGATVNEVIFTTDRSGGVTTYEWTNDNPAIGLGASGTGNIPTFAAINAGTAPDTARIRVIPYFDGACAGDPMQFEIVVNPTAQVDVQADTIVCNDQVTQIDFFTQNTGGNTTYHWTNTDPTIGLPATGTGDLSFTATNAGTAPKVATIAVTPRFNGGCDGPVMSFTITVNPTAQVNPVNDTVLCNGETVNEVVFGTNRIGGITTYTWTNDNTSIGLGATGTGNIPAFVAVNPGTAPEFANITVYPQFDGGCTGDPITFTIIVNPTAQVDQPDPDPVCDGSPLAIVFNTQNTGGVTTYEWFNDNPDIGLASGGTGNISFTTQNDTILPIQGNIRVVPTYTYQGVSCVGDTVVFPITVYPLGQVDKPDDQIVCNGESTADIHFVTNREGTNTFVWTNDNPSIGLEASGSGNISNFTATNAGTAPEVATIIVTPYYTYAGVVSCPGPSQTFTITVNPTAQVNPVNDTVVCNGDNLPAVVLSTVNTGGTTTYAWTNDTPSIGLAAAGTGNIPAFVAANPGTAPVEATITVWPTFEHGGHSCSGDSMFYTIIVNPTAQVDVPADQLLCDGETTDAVQFTTTRTGGVTTYAWTNDNPSIGLAASGTGDIAEFIATNNTSDAQIATIEVTPTFTYAGKSCDGPTQSFTISVNPVPNIDVELFNNDTICNEDNIVFRVDSLSNLILGNWKYQVVIDYDVLIGQLPTDSIYEVDQITDNLFNPDTAWHKATYHFIPIIDPADGGDSCTTPNDTIIEVYVDPTPAIRVLAQDSIVCSGDVATITINNPNEFVIGSWEYDLVIDPDPEIDLVYDSIPGIDSTIITRQLINTDTLVHKVEFRFTPTRSIEEGLVCAGGEDTTIIIWVNPVPEVRSGISDTVICDGETVDLNVYSPNTQVRGSWHYNLRIFPDPGIGGVSSGVQSFPNDSTFQFTLTNSASVVRSVRFRLEPYITDPDGQTCNNGIPVEYEVKVNPVPRVNVSVPDTVICNNQFLNVTVSNPNTSVVGLWQYELQVTAHAAISGARADGFFYAGTDLSFSDSLVNSDTAVHEVVYHLIPGIDGSITCGNGRDTTITVWVNPTPNIHVLPNDTLFCNNGVVDFTVLDGMGDVIGDKKYLVRALYPDNWVEVHSRPAGDVTTMDVPVGIRDSLVNLTNEVQMVIYTFHPRILDNRGGGDNFNCKPVVTPDPIRVWVNPTPQILIGDISDTLLCDSSLINIPVANGLTNVMGQSHYYLDVTYDPAGVDATVFFEGESANADVDINDYFENRTDTVQTITYRFWARIRDTRPGHAGDFCGNGTDTTITFRLNPTPRLQYSFLQGEDTLCFDDGFILQTDPRVYTTHDIYYGLDVSNPDGVDHVIVPPDSIRATLGLDESTISNPGLGVGTVSYTFHPYIHTLGCPARDTTVVIRVNPEPIVSLDKDVVPWAVCNDDGFLIPMRDTIVSTTGSMQYSLATSGYNPGNVGVIPADGFYGVDTIHQETVVNTGTLIEKVQYRITPVIVDAKGAGGHCWSDAPDSLVVEVAPELLGNSTPREWIGGVQIQCFGYENGEIESRVSGGYYDAEYDFAWGTTDGTAGSLVPADSNQFNLGAGTYFYEVTDTIGCLYRDTILLTQPDLLLVTDTVITEATCFSASSEDGGIDITVAGGILNYDFVWEGPWRNYHTEDLASIPGSEFPIL
ncbi:MAG: hypothetical protein R2751_09420 [Bacteroidales bacterium]